MRHFNKGQFPYKDPEKEREYQEFRKQYEKSKTMEEMTKEHAAEILEAHNEWRRDENVPNSKEMQNPTEIGKAIDVAVAELRKGSIQQVLENHQNRMRETLQNETADFYLLAIFDDLMRLTN